MLLYMHYKVGFRSVACPPKNKSEKHILHTFPTLDLMTRGEKNACRVVSLPNRQIQIYQTGYARSLALSQPQPLLLDLFRWKMDMCEGYILGQCVTCVNKKRQKVGVCSRVVDQRAGQGWQTFSRRGGIAAL